MGQQRARLDAEKSGRRQEILAAAAELWRTTSYEGFRMADLAAAAGLAKGTVYLYFPTKEELFLCLMEDRLAIWLDRLAKGLGRLKDAGARQVAAEVQSTIEKDPALDHGLRLLDGVLLRGAGDAARSRFDEHLESAMSRTAKAFEQTLPDLEPGSGAEVLLLVRALYAGFAQMEGHRKQFRRDFENGLANALRGMTRKKGKKK